MVYARILVCFVLSLFIALGAHPARGEEVRTELSVSVPGPLNLTYLPIDLITKIGADVAEGARVEVRHFGGGGVALKEMTSRNVDFAVAGMPAAMSLRANGGDVVVVAAVSADPLFVFMVRADLRGEIKRVADLRGKRIGVNTSSLTSKTTSQQLAELVLKSDGVLPDQYRIIPAGQSWEAQSEMLSNGRVDAIMGDEPFASRLLAAGKVFFLVNLADPEQARQVPGAGFLHAALETRGELIAKEPGKVEQMVRIVRRTLEWMGRSTPEEIVAKLAISDVESRTWLLAALQKYPRMYSPDGRFSTAQLRETERFFQESSPEGAAHLKNADLVNDRWSGKRD